METKNVLLCVATEKGLSVLKAINCEMEINIHVTTFKEVKVISSFDEAIKLYSKENNISISQWKEIKNQGIKWLKDNQIWAIVCVGWRYIIPQDWMEFLDGRVLVTHDSLLPKYRGFAPVASAMINGEEFIGVSIMLAAKEMDEGDIIYQKKIKIAKDSTIKTIIDNLIPLFQEGVVTSLNKLFSNSIIRLKQDHSKATYSLWRDENDLWINWSESASRINRTIRALGFPYLGARTKYESDVVVVHESKIIKDIPFEIRQPGKIWKLTSDGKPIVVCGKGLLLIENASIKEKPFIPINKLRSRFY